MEIDSLTQTNADHIWDIVVKEANARENERESWRHCLNTSRYSSCEYRICGPLGFGGKLWVTRDKWYVNCYQEDETPARLEIIERTNRQLDQLREEALGKEKVSAAGEDTGSSAGGEKGEPDGGSS